MGEVTEAAIAIADARGLEAVTMRSVAARLGVGAMSLYSYVPDKQALMFRMVERVSAEIELPAAPSGDWRADLHRVAQQQRAAVHRHPWLVDALSHHQPLGPVVLDYLEFSLAALEPLGMDATSALEALGLLNGFVVNLARGELEDRRRAGAGGGPAAEAAAHLQLADLLASGRYPRFAAAVSSRPIAPLDLGAQFERLLDRVLDGLFAPSPRAGGPGGPQGPTNPESHGEAGERR